jgi:predicted nucleotidyltransferase
MDKKSQLLLFLFSNFDSLTNVREISRETKIPRSTTSRLLQEMYSEGILVRKEVGNQSIYTINTKNPLTLSLCSVAFALKFNELKISPSIRRQIASFVNSCSKTLGSDLLAITLFGSAARGEVMGASDIDVMVLLRSLDKTKEVERVAQAINASYTRNLSPTNITPKTFSTELKAGNLLYIKIIKEGIPVFGVESYLREVFNFIEGTK